MRFLPAAVLALTLVAGLFDSTYVMAKKPTRPRPVANRRPGGRPSSGRPPVSRRRQIEEEEDEDDEDEDMLGYPGESEDEEEDDFLDEDEEDEDDLPVRPSKGRKSAASRRPPVSRTSRSAASRSSPRARPPPSRRRYDDEDDLPRQRGSRGPPPNRGGRDRRRPGGSVVRYSRPEPSAFSKGVAFLRSSMPDPAAVKDAALSSLSAARETTSNLSTNLYREVKGLTSSELEQVMLKATRPDDTAVKGKHVERLVGVTYQINSRYDIYDAVLRKLWSKMAEKDWRTTIKALYILHRFAADGAPEHAPALKARLRELRRTRDPKRKDKYFNSKQLLAGESNPENIKFRAFMSRYAHYVLLRAQCFGGIFDEISQLPKPDKKKAPKPITATSLRVEHLEAATMLLKAGVACQLKEGEECENTAIAVERVASDLIGLTTAVAIALNRSLKDPNLKGADPALLKRWCVFYSTELQPRTRAMVKKTSPKLDAYGLFLPSRMGTSVSPDLLEKGLHLDDASTAEESPSAAEDASMVSEETPASKHEEDEEEEEDDEEEAEAIEREAKVDEPEDIGDGALDEDGELDDEYEYDEEEYYDDEDE